ncbi:Asn/Gln amidotransferase domain protein, partial [mine drainage metagenome]
TRFAPSELSALIGLVQAGKVTQSAAKTALEALAQKGGRAEEVLAALGLAQIDDREAVLAEVRAVLEAEAKAVEDLRAGKDKAISYLVGQVMRRTRGRVPADLAARLIREEAGV